MVYLYILIILTDTVLGQQLLKQGIANLVEILPQPANGAWFLLRALANPVVILSLLFAFAAALAWIASVSKADLSFAHPFTSLAR